MSRTLRRSVVFGMAVCGPLSTIALLSIRVEPGLRLIFGEYIAYFFCVVGMAACIYLVFALRGAGEFSGWWHLRWGAGFWFLLTVFVLVVMNMEFNPPTLIHKKSIAGGNLQVYVYEQTCFPPDGRAECKDYVNYIYVRRRFSPLMVLRGRFKRTLDRIAWDGKRILLFTGSDNEPALRLSPR